MNNDDFCMILQKTIYYKTDTEFLLGLLHSIFSTAKRYYLKKCNRCGKPLPFNYEFGICQKCFKAQKRRNWKY